MGEKAYSVFAMKFIIVFALLCCTLGTNGQQDVLRVVGKMVGKMMSDRLVGDLACVQCPYTAKTVIALVSAAKEKFSLEYNHIMATRDLEILI